MSFKFIPQHDKMDCGPSCLAMVSNYFGKNYSLQFFRENSFITREGVSLLGISEAANKVGLKTISTKLVITELVDKIDNLPCIIHWNKNHHSHNSTNYVKYSLNRNIPDSIMS